MDVLTKTTVPLILLSEGQAAVRHASITMNAQNPSSVISFLENV